MLLCATYSTLQYSLYNIIVYINNITITWVIKCSSLSQQVSASIPTIISLFRSLRLWLLILINVSIGRQRMRGNKLREGCWSKFWSDSSNRIPPSGAWRPIVIVKISFISPFAEDTILSAPWRNAYIPGNINNKQYCSILLHREY